MKGSRKTLVAATAALLFSVVFGILFLACEQREDIPDTRADTPATADAKPDSPPAPAVPKPGGRRRVSFDEINDQVQSLGEQIEGFRSVATEDLAGALGEIEAKHAQLAAELDAIGGEKEKWDAARSSIAPKARDLRRRVHEFGERVN